MNIRRYKLSYGALVGVIFFSAIALSSVFAQRIAGGIRGKVTDLEENPLANVKIILFDTKRGNRIELKTDKKGNFFRRGLAASVYELTYQLEGYRTIRSKVRISRDRTPLLKIALEKYDPKALVEEDFKIGKMLFREGKYQDAISIFKIIIDVAPDYADAHHSIALCYITTKEFDKAVASLEKAVELKPGFAPNYVALGQIYSEKGKADEAIKYYKKAVELQPNDAQIYFKMGAAYYNMQKFDEAIEVIERSLDLDASNTYSYYQLAMIYRGLKNREKMIENFEKFLKINPDAPEALQVRELIKKAKEQLSKQKMEN